LYQGTTLQAAEKLMLVSGHEFAGCGKTHVLYQGTTLQAAEKLMLCIRARLQSGRKRWNEEGFSPLSIFCEGHGFQPVHKQLQNGVF
jgi:hypothetical protein